MRVMHDRDAKPVFPLSQGMVRAFRHDLTDAAAPVRRPAIARCVGLVACEPPLARPC